MAKKKIDDSWVAELNWKREDDRENPGVFSIYDSQRKQTTVVCTFGEDVTPADDVGFTTVLRPYQGSARNSKLAVASPKLYAALKKATEAIDNAGPRGMGMIREWFDALMLDLDTAMAAAVEED